MKCKAFDDCIQPHICYVSNDCIWGQEKEERIPQVIFKDISKAEALEKWPMKHNPKNIDRFSGDDPNALTLKSPVQIGDNIRINRAVFNHFNDGQVHMKVLNGTMPNGGERFCNFRFQQEDLKILRKWLDKVIKQE